MAACRPESAHGVVPSFRGKTGGTELGLGILLGCSWPRTGCEVHPKLHHSHCRRKGLVVLHWTVILLFHIYPAPASVLLGNYVLNFHICVCSKKYVSFLWLSFWGKNCFVNNSHFRTMLRSVYHSFWWKFALLHSATRFALFYIQWMFTVNECSTGLKLLTKVIKKCSLIYRWHKYNIECKHLLSPFSMNKFVF